MSSFTCKGFSYRAPQSAGEVLNCDLTDQDTTTLDTYTDFYPNTNTDFYERSGTGSDCRTASAPGSSRRNGYKVVVYHYVIFLLRVLRVVQEQHQALHLQGLQDQHQCRGLCRGMQEDLLVQLHQLQIFLQLCYRYRQLSPL